MNTAVRGLSSVAPQRQMTTTSAAGRPMWSVRTLEHQRLQVVAQALNRQAKEETVSKIVPLLEESTVVVGLRYQGLTVKQMQQFRRSLPAEGATLLVCKNTLIKLAADQVEGWEELKPAAKGDNAWLFVQEEEISESIKAYLKFQKEVEGEVPPEERDSITALKMSGGVMSGKALTDADIKRLEKMPTKAELMATIARLLNQLPTKVAVSVKQVPNKLAYGVKALADADDNKEAVVGDVLPKSE
ncbi:hypothetical protein M9434_004036 [Picochlorum sp. BPE23]|nr:hypothetical protein M9434_004036 [Picochlorum sp. BPE23]